ncbi:replication initiator protein A [Deinococcus hopiensis]|nr:replication initiator protein A [Deinococcus hopiensis]
MPPQDKPELTVTGDAGHDEINLNRLMFVVAANRVPETAVGWEKSVTIDALGPIRIRCTAGRDNVVPHGIDNDIVVGLVNVYVQQGMPDDGRVTVTVAELLRASGLSKNGRVYREVRESLLRLSDTKYDFSKSWYDAEQQTWLDEEGFRLILQYRFLNPQTGDTLRGQFKAETTVQLTLASLLTRSIRAGHLRPLDLAFYSELSQPMVRTLYRLLREQSFGADGRPVHVFSISVRAWAIHLGHHDTRIDLVRRALKPAHAELMGKGFLKDVTYSGRGEAQSVTYEFADNLQPPPDAELVGLLAQRGVTMPAATKLAVQYSRAQIVQACESFDALLRSGYAAKSRGGLLTDMLRSPSKYVPREELLPVQRPLPRAARAGPADEEMPATPEARARTAEFLLSKGRTPHPDHRRRILLDLFVTGAINAQELTLVGSAEDPDALVMSWVARRQVQRRDEAPSTDS